MGWRGTIILFLGALLAAATYFATVQERRAELPTETLLGEPRFIDPMQRGRKLVDVAPAEVAEIELESGKDRFTAQRSDSGWSGAIDAPKLDDFLTSLGDLREIAAIEGGTADLSSYGLQLPARIITLKLRTGTAIRVAVGDRNPAATALYVRIDDGPVTLAGALLLWEFEKAVTAISGRPLHS